MGRNRGAHGGAHGDSLSGDGAACGRVQLAVRRARLPSELLVAAQRRTARRSCELLSLTHSLFHTRVHIHVIMYIITRAFHNESSLTTLLIPRTLYFASQLYANPHGQTALAERQAAVRSGRGAGGPPARGRPRAYGVPVRRAVRGRREARTSALHLPAPAAGARGARGVEDEARRRQPPDPRAQHAAPDTIQVPVSRPRVHSQLHYRMIDRSLRIFNTVITINKFLLFT